MNPMFQSRGAANVVFVSAEDTSMFEQQVPVFLLVLFWEFPHGGALYD